MGHLKKVFHFYIAGIAIIATGFFIYSVPLLLLGGLNAENNKK
jgi:hypothetical protein